MGKENGSSTGGDNRPMHPAPPPEAFRHSESFRFPPDQNNQHEDNRKDESENEQQNRNETSEEATGMLAAQRPLIRRQSSLFGQLPVRSKSRLFDDLVTTSTSTVQNTNKSNAVVDSIVAETMTNFSHSQPTWLQDDHQSTLSAGDSRFGDTRSQSRNEHPRLQQEQRPGEKSSLFGAVMRQFGSSISSALPPSSPFGRRRTSSTVESSPQKTGSGFGSGSGGAFRGLMASPSGKTIMNIVNQFNSPFKFQSPSSNHKKRHRRRRLWNDDEDSKDNDKITTEKREAETFYTPKKRRKMNEEDENSKTSGNLLFPDHDANDSRSSLGGGLVDEHWREAPIVEVGDKIRMEVLDWSLVTKVRIEAHGGASKPMTETWLQDAMRDNEDSLTYWMYQSPIFTDESTGTHQSSGLLAHSSSNLSVLQKSISASKISMSRQGSFGSRFDAKITNAKSKSGSKKTDESDVLSYTNQLAKHLIQSVRGPHAKYSRKRVLIENSWWDEQTISTSSTLRDDTRERSCQQWQRALRCLFSNYRRRVLHRNNLKDCLNAMVLDTYFYCIGQDHSVLFRISASGDADSEFNNNSNSGKAVPVVLVSSTSDSFRKKLESNGMDLSQSNDCDESFQLMESIMEREARERKKIIAATAAAARKSKRIFNNVLLSPSVKADLEALRRAQAFGESAGADVMVKVKKKGDGADEDEKEKLPKGTRISGWDNVSLFLEVYLNLLGDAMCDEAAAEIGTTLPFLKSKPSNKILPLLICPNTNDFGPFDHASLKRLSLLPAERIPDYDSKSDEKKNADESSTKDGNAMEIRGIVLPCAIRKILLLTRDRILKEEKIVSASSSLSDRGDTKGIASEPHTENNDSDSSRYIVLHSSRPTIANRQKEPPKSWIGGLNGSLIFNQGNKKKSKSKSEDGNGNKSGQFQVFECSYGNVVSMAVWDTSREEVAACKLDGAFPENWIHKR